MNFCSKPVSRNIKIEKLVKHNSYRTCSKWSGNLPNRSNKKQSSEAKLGLKTESLPIFLEISKNSYSSFPLCSFGSLMNWESIWTEYWNLFSVQNSCWYWKKLKFTLAILIAPYHELAKTQNCDWRDDMRTLWFSI